MVNTGAMTEATPANADARAKNLAATASVVGAFGASACCILPLVLFSVGIGGAWISNLTALYPYKWFIVIPTLAVLAYGFYLVYRKPLAACDANAACARPISGRIVKSSLWLATVLVAAAIAFPYVAPFMLNV
ncbi:MAG: mercuric transporter MerT family protein [Hyphomicrobiales bacterium]